MLIEERVTVAASADDAWRFLLDLPSVASCLPGARFDERIDDRTYDGQLEMKVGPIALRYRGRVSIEDVDERTREAMLVALGTDQRGGTATARMRMGVSGSASGTQIDLAVDLTLTGRAAQFGRGIVDDVTRVMIKSFSTEFERHLRGLEASSSCRPATALRETTGAEVANVDTQAASPAVRAASAAQPVASERLVAGRVLHFEADRQERESAGPTVRVHALAIEILRGRYRALAQWIRKASPSLSRGGG